MTGVAAFDSLALDGVPAEHRPELNALLTQCYADMRSIARRIMTGNALSSVYQPTELTNEVVVKLVRSTLLSCTSKSHLLATAARTMRQVLIDEARKIHADKRRPPTCLTVWPDGASDEQVDFGALDEALIALKALSQPRSEVVELRFMLGLSVAETAEAMGLSERTVKRHWQEARAWLIDYLQR
jgi:RNA polymerase sigma factor (TIGR02999 family)